MTFVFSRAILPPSMIKNVKVNRQKSKFGNGDFRTRIHRIMGQVEAVGKMTEDKAGCLELVQQILAAKNALSSLAVEILSQESCKIGSREKRKELLEKIIREV